MLKSDVVRFRVHPDSRRPLASLAELDAIIAAPCVRLTNDTQRIKGQTGFHWWPKIAKPS